MEVESARPPPARPHDRLGYGRSGGGEGRCRLTEMCWNADTAGRSSPVMLNFFSIHVRLVSCRRWEGSDNAPNILASQTRGTRTSASPPIRSGEPISIARGQSGLARPGARIFFEPLHGDDHSAMDAETVQHDAWIGTDGASPE